MSKHVKDIESQDFFFFFFESQDFDQDFVVTKIFIK